MRRSATLPSARRAMSALGIALLTVLAVHAATPANTVAMPNTGIASTGAPATPNKTNTLKPQVKQNIQLAAARPLWIELTPAQQQALAPLAPEWDKLDANRKNKWLAIGNKFANMKPNEQQRMQERMRDWVNLTPEQRRIARESYARAKTLNPDQKSAQWQQYQQLPEEQKKKLAADAASKKHVATLPSAAAQANANKTVPPIKSASKRVIERSVTPQAASQSALQPTSAHPVQ